MGMQFSAFEGCHQRIPMVCGEVAVALELGPEPEPADCFAAAEIVA